jgi:hypothetical protein
MITIQFDCPKCGIACLCGVRSRDDLLSLATELPVCLRCGGCGIESFVIANRTNWFPSTDKWYRFFGHCLRIAAVCRNRSIETRSARLRTFFLKQERYWLRMGWESDYRREAAIIAAQKTHNLSLYVSPRFGLG